MTEKGTLKGTFIQIGGQKVLLQIWQNGKVIWDHPKLCYYDERHFERDHGLEFMWQPEETEDNTGDRQDLETN